MSVIIIFLDEARFLQEAIDSVFCQTLTDWELILVDDGSTDGSSKIAKAAAQDPRVTYCTHPGAENRGMSASRNLGVERATGKYISYLDGDDVWLHNKLELQVSDLTLHESARLTYGPVVTWRSWQEGNTADDDGRYGLEGDSFTLTPDRLYDPPQLVRRFLFHKDLVPAGEMFERSLFLEVGGANEDFRGNYEDGVVFVKMLLRASAYCTSTATYLYRQHDDSSTAQDRAAGLSDQARQRFLDWVAQYLRDENISDPGLWLAIWRARLPVRRPRLDPVVRSGFRTARLARKGGALLLGQARLATKGRLVRIPIPEITDEFGFDLTADGWNCYTSILREYDDDPHVDPLKSEFARFFKSRTINSVTDLNSLFDLGSTKQHFRTLPRFWLGTYPWGGLGGETERGDTERGDTERGDTERGDTERGDTERGDTERGDTERGDTEHLSLGPAFGWAHDTETGEDTSLLWGRGRTLWHKPDDDFTIANEWRITVELYPEIKAGYSPLKARGFPSVTILKRANGERKAVICDGHHRLATLAHLGSRSVTVEVLNTVKEQEVSDWVAVRNGVCTDSEALQFFDAFFTLTGNERLQAALGQDETGS